MQLFFKFVIRSIAGIILVFPGWIIKIMFAAPEKAMFCRDTKENLNILRFDKDQKAA
jgi:hypothetical protein